MSQAKCIAFVMRISATLNTSSEIYVFQRNEVSPIAEPFYTRAKLSRVQEFLQWKEMEKSVLAFSLLTRNEILSFG